MIAVGVTTLGLLAILLRDLKDVPALSSPVLAVVLLMAGSSGIISVLLPYSAESYPLQMRGRATGWVAGFSKAGGLLAQGLGTLAIWAHVPTQEWVEGTTLYMISPTGGYMEWIWEIPIRPGVSSIGYVAPGSSVKTQRAAGSSSHDVLAHHCRRFPRLHEIIDHTGSFDAAATTFLCRTYENVCGTNWVIIGEAASQSDPITGNGVTAAAPRTGGYGPDVSLPSRRHNSRFRPGCLESACLRRRALLQQPHRKAFLSAHAPRSSGSL